MVIKKEEEEKRDLGPEKVELFDLVGKVDVDLNQKNVSGLPWLRLPQPPWNYYHGHTMIYRKSCMIGGIS